MLAHKSVFFWQVLRLVAILRLFHAFVYALVDTRALGDRTNFAAAEYPDAFVGFMLRIVRVSLVLGCGCASFVDLHAAGARFGEHPLQGEIRKPALVVPASHIRVHADEPDLLDCLAGNFFSLIPKVWWKIRSLLVDGKGVIAELHFRVKPGAL